MNEKKKSYFPFQPALKRPHIHQHDVLDRPVHHQRAAIAVVDAVVAL